jgi:hypothetical protein
MREQLRACGLFTAECRDARGRLRWREVFPNLLTTQGKNFILDQALNGANYSATIYQGLIGATSYSALAATDTMLSHAGWVEQNFSGLTRVTTAWAVASGGSKTFSAPSAFVRTPNPYTLKGCFLCGGVATSAPGNTAGSLICEGLFVGGDNLLLAGDSITVGYTMSI